MKPLHERTLNEQSLMPRDWLRRRMTRLVHRGETPSFRPSLTLVDISNWFTVDYVYIRDLENGKKVITDEWQVKLSQFFYMLDVGLIELKVKGRKKTWARATPAEPPCKEARPRVAFLAAGPKLKFD